MDAVEFLKERVRMCNSFYECDGCPISPDCIDTDIKKLVSEVEQWSQTHPQKTMIQDFFEKFPNAPRTQEGTPRICPSDCGYEKLSNCPNGEICNSLKCWSRPLED